MVAEVGLQPDIRAGANTGSAAAETLRRLFLGWPWLAGAVLSLLLRTPLALMPGPGRDEAAYFYWAVQGEFGYAPFLVALVRVLHDVGFPDLWAIRLPGLVGGVVSLLLLDRFLAARGLGRPDRLLGVLAVAVTPWHVWVSSALHPDPWLLSALLALGLALQGNHLFRAAAFGGLAALAKPTGLVLLPLLLVWFWRAAPGRRRLPAMLALVGVATPALAGLSPDMIREMAEFGRLSAELPAWHGVLLAFMDLVLAAGFLLPAAALQGFLEGRRGTPSGGARSTRSHLILAGALLVFFAAAAVLNRQVKAGWILPALVLAWPSRPLRLPRPAILILLTASLLSSVVLVGLTRFPALAGEIDSRVSALFSYEDRAGTREERVSPSRSWSDWFGDPAGVRHVAAGTLRAWQEAKGATHAPRCIVADDYGLAAQLAFHWESHETRIVVPNDGLFRHRFSDLKHENPRDILILGTQNDPERVWTGTGRPVAIGALVHPTTGGSIQLAVLAPESLPSAAEIENIHAGFDSLLARYVTESGVKYADWSRHAEDGRRLSDYIDRMEATPVASLERPAALAFWINLYNAVTLELVLDHYPVKSIKETAGFLKSPWKKKLVRVEGKSLSLDDIENRIIRPRFNDARIHFALNCAAVGCPPLARQAFRGAKLDEQLDAACRRALNDERWVRVEGSRLVLSKIFDWYREDFVREAGSVPAFIAPFRTDGDGILELSATLTIRHLDYDWSLNESR